MLDTVKPMVSAEYDSLTHQDLYRVILNDRVQSVFPNVEAILRLQFETRGDLVYYY